MGPWALAGGLNNLWYGSISAHRVTDALQCLCWGVINVLTINNDYTKKVSKRVVRLTIRPSSKKTVFVSGLKTIGVLPLGWDTKEECKPKARTVVQVYGSHEEA
ncbi:hypothetical protein WMY93_022977 [Mugilogobius chulae]|uniref:Uncharacterized protein n=1 Tax=Mugilogobius chulae TaxID=88201 RepID=A0AAW0N327_9GOBI